MSVVVRRGTVAELHEPISSPVPQVVLCEPTDDALVLGSSQSVDLVDAAACQRAGLAVVRRRSGGGAVLVRRDEIVWIDLVLPHGHVPDDVRASMEWAGELWRAALAPDASAVGRDVVLSVQRGGMIASPWSRLVCFAGLGPGEVLVDGVKLVGLSQRRTRGGVRIQGMVHRVVDHDVIVRCLAAPLPPGAPPTPATLAHLDAFAVAERLADGLCANGALIGPR